MLPRWLRSDAEKGTGVSDPDLYGCGSGGGNGKGQAGGYSGDHRCLPPGPAKEISCRKHFCIDRIGAHRSKSRRNSPISLSVGRDASGRDTSNCGQELRTAGEIFCRKEAKYEGDRCLFPGPPYRKTSYALQIWAEDRSISAYAVSEYGIVWRVGGHFPEEGSTIADVVVLFQDGGEGSVLDADRMVSHMGLWIICCRQVSEDIKTVPAKDWEQLLRQILTEGMYEAVILDLDEGIQGVYGLLRMCTEIHVPVLQDRIGTSKMLQFEEELHLLGI